jgi:acetyl esterase/lipase
VSGQQARVSNGCNGARDAEPGADARDWGASLVAEVWDRLVPAANFERTIPARVYVPYQAAPAMKLEVFLFIHGSGCVSGDPDTDDALVRALANETRRLFFWWATGWRLNTCFRPARTTAMLS